MPVPARAPVNVARSFGGGQASPPPPGMDASMKRELTPSRAGAGAPTGAVAAPLRGPRTPTSRSQLQQVADAQSSIDTTMRAMTDTNIPVEARERLGQQLQRVVQSASTVAQAGQPEGVTPEAWDSFLRSLDSGAQLSTGLVSSTAGPGLWTYVGIGALALAVGVGVWIIVRKD